MMGGAGHLLLQLLLQLLLLCEQLQVLKVLLLLVSPGLFGRPRGGT